MPFDPAPKPAEIHTVPCRFQDVVDAILRGCAMHPMGIYRLFCDGRTCVMGAAFVGMGITPPDETTHQPFELFDSLWKSPVGERLGDVADAYRLRYGVQPQSDNNAQRFTREEIAARIAAL